MTDSPMQLSISMTQTRTRRMHSYRGPLTNDVEHLKRKYCVFFHDTRLIADNPNAWSTYTLEFEKVVGPTHSPCMVQCSKDLRNSGSVSDHDMVVKIDTTVK